MIDVYLLSAEALREEAIYGQSFAKLDAERRKKVEQAKRAEDKILRMGAGLLLQYAVKRRLEGTADEGPVFVYGEKRVNCKQVSLEEVLSEIREPLEFSYKYGPHGKPYLEQYPEVFFSLSHSGEYVICALSEKEVGADIQMIPQYRPDRLKREQNILDRFFSETEAKQVADIGTEKGRRNFYRIWAAKEAFMKLTGKGLSRGLDTFFVNPETESVTDKETEVARIFELPAPKEYVAFVCLWKEK